MALAWMTQTGKPLPRMNSPICELPDGFHPTSIASVTRDVTDSITRGGAVRSKLRATSRGRARMFTSKSNSTAAELEDHLAIIELINRMVLGLDSKDWDGLVPLFAESVFSDRTSLTGGDPETLSAEAFVGGWRWLMANLDAIHHIVSNHVVNVDGDRATCTANMLGTHVLVNPSGGSMWQVGGHHNYQLTRTPDGWRIAGITFIIQWATGNQNILTLSMAANDSA
jgi:hypothetical protein